MNMKLRVYKAQLLKALVWYLDQVLDEYGTVPIHTASLEQMNEHLQKVQIQQQIREPNDVWKVPVSVKPNVDHTNIFIVPDEKNVLYLDFDLF